MSYSKFRQEHGSGEFGAFLKAEHCQTLPIRLDLIRVDEQELPQTGASLVARFAFDGNARKQLRKEYTESLDKVQAKDIAFPLNATNGKRLAAWFGDSLGNWHGSVTFKVVTVTNPKDGEEVEVLRVVEKPKATK